ncbi:hypothetical protein HPB50_029185 [Hyalomma asiaticum]|nr:hypothetical protein HPB50_029185 [Hyalomma asiaticum]
MASPRWPAVSTWRARGWRDWRDCGRIFAGDLCLCKLFHQQRLRLYDGPGVASFRECLAVAVPQTVGQTMAVFLEANVYVSTSFLRMGTKGMWKTAIPRENFEPTKHTAVCEKHFRTGDFVRVATYTDVKPGKVHEAPLERVRLKRTVVPSLFPGCPKYISQPTPTLEAPAGKNARLEAALKHDAGHLTKETHLSFGQTSRALHEISVYCLEELKFQYVLLGKFQTNSLEDRFRKYRQLSVRTRADGGEPPGSGLRPPDDGVTGTRAGGGELRNKDTLRLNAMRVGCTFLGLREHYMVAAYI